MERGLPFLDRTIPDEMLKDPELRSRARLVQCFYVLGAVGFSAAAISRYSASGVLLTSHLVSILAFTLGIAVLSVTRDLRFGASLALILGLGGVLANALQLGGLVFVLSWASVLVGAAVYTLGMRAALMVGGISIAAAFGMATLRVIGFYPPLTAEAVSVQAGSGMAAATMVSIQVAAMLVFLGFYHREHRVLNESLVRARLEAEASDRAKSVFLATMSHEIRTPMNGVLAAADLLRRSQLPVEEKALAEIVYQSGDALLSLLNDILDFSKLEAGKVHMEHLPFSPRELAAATIELQRHRARQKGLALELEVASDVPECLIGDASRLRQVLLNLLGNAVKFTDAGMVQLLIRRGPKGIEFRVEDTGPGLSVEQRGRLFERFVQSDDSVHRTHGGTGLGLAISRHLVEAMGGKIAVDSEPGRGSVFHFELELPEGTAVESELVPDGTGDIPLLDGLVLVVDDNAINRKVAENMLRRLGCETASVEDGESALDRLKAVPVALVLMDRQMPVLDGLATTRRIRALDGALGFTPVVGLTASVFSEEVAACIEAGMQAVLSKPVTMSALSGAIRHWARHLPAPTIQG